MNLTTIPTTHAELKRQQREMAKARETPKFPVVVQPVVINQQGGGTGGTGTQGPPGQNGKSAYETWLDAGNTGTEAQFLASLVGGKGDKGDPGVGIHILGSFPDLPSLQAAHPTGNPGDAWLVGGFLYVWVD